MKFIKNFDLISQSPSLNFDMDNKKFKTPFGGFISILILMICIVGLYFFGQELWLKESPSVNISKISENNPGPYMLDSLNFDFTIYIAPSGFDPIIDPRIFTVSSSIYSFDSKGILFKRPLELVPCNQTKFTNFDLTFNFNTGSMFCVSKNQTFLNSADLKIQGYYGNSDFQMIVHKFYMCDNSTSKVPCLSQEKINSFLSDAYLTFNVYDNMIQTNNFTNPSQRSMKNYYFTVSSQLYTSSNLYFNQVDILSDTGLVFSSIEKKTIYENEILMNNINIISSKKIASLSFQLDNFKYIYKRNYKKVQDVAAQIGGIISGIKILAIIFTQSTTTHFFYQSLVNSFFNFDTNAVSELQKINVKFSKNDNSVSKTNNFIFSKDEDFMRRTSMDSKLIYRKYIEHKKNQITIDFHPLYILFFCHKIRFSKRKKDSYMKEEMFEKAKLKIKEMLLVENYLNIFLEIDKLKYFLLNSQQIAIFDLIKNPLMSKISKCEDKSLTQYILRNLNHKPNFNSEKLISIFENLISKNDEISQKILSSITNF